MHPQTSRVLGLQDFGLGSVTMGVDAVLAAAWVVEAVFFALVVFAKPVQNRKFLHPESRAAKALWLLIRISCKLLAELFFLTLFVIFLLAWDCTATDGGYRLDATDGSVACWEGFHVAQALLHPTLHYDSHTCCLHSTEGDV